MTNIGVMLVLLFVCSTVLHKVGSVDFIHSKKRWQNNGLLMGGAAQFWTAWHSKEQLHQNYLPLHPMASRQPPAALSFPSLGKEERKPHNGATLTLCCRFIWCRVKLPYIRLGDLMWHTRTSKTLLVLSPQVPLPSLPLPSLPLPQYASYTSTYSDGTDHTGLAP